MVRPAFLACVLMCSALALVGLFSDGRHDDRSIVAETPVQTPPMALVAEDPCGNLGNSINGSADAAGYCDDWFDAQGVPSILNEPDEWAKYYANAAAEDTFTWWMTSPDPIIGNSGYDSSLLTETERNNADANNEAFSFSKGKFSIFVIAFSAAGCIFSLILVARSGDPTAAKKSLRGPAYAVVSVALTVPLINANVMASNAFAKWIIVTGLPSGQGDPSPERSLQTAIRQFTERYENSNYFLEMLFLICITIASLVLYIECIFRLFLVVAAAATIPVMASLSGTSYGREAFRRTVAVIAPLCWLDAVQAIGMVIPLRLLEAHQDTQSGVQSGFIAVFGMFLVCFMPGAMIRVTLPIAAEVAGTGENNRRLADAAPAMGARVVAGAAQPLKAAGGLVKAVRNPSGSR